MVELQGSLNISVDGVTARFTAEKDKLTLDLDEPIPFLKASHLFHKSSIKALRLLAEQLHDNELTLTIVSANQTLAVIGYEVNSGIASSLLGAPHLEIMGAGLISLIKG